jgi:hypothetical protein
MDNLDRRNAHVSLTSAIQVFMFEWYLLDISYESFSGFGLIEMTTENTQYLNDEAAAGIREMIVIVLTD